MSSPLLKIFATSLLLSSLAAADPRAPTPAQEARAGARSGGAEDCGRLPPSRKLDEYGVLSAGEEGARLERLAAALKAEPEDTVAFVIGYAGRAGRAGEGLARADAVKRALAEKPGFDSDRLNTLDCGRRGAPATEFWITPAGASPPRCTPTLDPQPAPAKGAAARPRRGSRRL